MANDFDWNRKRNVQRITTNKIIENISLSPKEVIAAGGNRIGTEQVMASICAAVMELITLHEEQAARINKMYERISPHAAEPRSEEPESGPRDTTGV